MVTFKQCTKCKETKSVSEYHAQASHKDGFASACKSCESLRSKLKNQKNREKRLAKAKEYREANKKLCYETSKNWRNKNKERVAKVLRNWANKNKDKVNAKWMKYKASKHQRTLPWLTIEHFKEMEDIYFLAKDASLITGEPYEVDHIIPLQGETVSGLHVPWNLQVLPRDLNRKKSNTLL